jgi:hypothetical protein
MTPDEQDSLVYCTRFGRKSMDAVQEIPDFIRESTTSGTSNKRSVRRPSGQKKRTEALQDIRHIWCKMSCLPCNWRIQGHQLAVCMLRFDRWESSRDIWDKLIATWSLKPRKFGMFERQKYRKYVTYNPTVKTYKYLRQPCRCTTVQVLFRTASTGGPLSA